MSEHLELLDWRRRVHDLYADVRAGLAQDPSGAHERWRVGRDALFAGHPQSPLEPGRRRRFAGLPCYPYDPHLRFLAPLEEDASPESFPVTTSAATPMAFLRIGAVDLPVGRLEVFWLDAYAGGLFLPFRDATAGDTTYGGGRYLLDTAKGADLGSVGGRLVLDFNFAYHPSCHYSPAWACPLAPPGNRLEARVEAGERLA